ncbi:DUF1302 domain-containing protein [Pseudomonas sp. P66]|uniref:DUF1302 domain-containing protein n=1 Tax=Pseudomonas arcuscaelestis TaxID=2710591 RepID=A0ABS2BVH8_9PSED|nr:DUF1302 domain-containing protein [Pseudomonas arcuscaelestis]MBM3114080.1 DUF1302 domain-containing protein [Pseudomonas arcuscaelestis]MBM5456981.1 DUF1302 domain-containing protein [Pseudomonas arcuscaelestis]
MTTTIKRARFQLSALASTIALSVAGQAQAVSFTLGEIDGQLDSSLSVGASWSTQSPHQGYIGGHNGGTGLSQTGDDGHLNFKQGETFSKIFKGIHDLELKYGDSGVFVRGKYWYDFELKDEERPFKNIDDHGRKEGAKSSGAQLLDAFVYHNYIIGEQPGSVRLGKQVVSWGESTFIQNSINSVNPVDVSAFRRPGAEIKEGLIPVNMFYVSQSLTDSLSAEAFYQLEWDQTVVDNCGTFFSQTDVVADGCTGNLNVLTPQLGAFGALLGYQTTSEGVVIPRGGDHDARDSGQWGAALRYMFEPLDTEFGAYFMNYHSRAPFFSTQAASQADYQQSAGVLAGAVPGIPAAARPGAAIANVAGGSQYFIEYPEDIRLYGLSFATTLPTGTAWSGEISYRPNAPLQLNTTDVLYAGVRGIAGMNPAFAPFGQYSLLGGDPASIPGSTLRGYNRKEITQLQTTFTHFFDQIMGADRLTLIGEIGVAHIGGLEKTSEARYGRDPVYGPGALPGVLTGGQPSCQAINTGTYSGTPAAVNTGKYCNDKGFATSTSWGYRARAIWDYSNVFAGINLKPSVAWSHDVDGYGPTGLFNEGAKAVSLGLDAEYRNAYSAGISYTNFFGGDFNTTTDRDFLALSLGMSF